MLIAIRVLQKCRVDEVCCTGSHQGCFTPIVPSLIEPGHSLDVGHQATDAIIKRGYYVIMTRRERFFD